ncbi:MAG TPA: hypothetical protein VFY97_01015 [Rhodanobacteraceae bacterium]|nr:hypothetical protein [Rhodanobacteraceae bacterium]
MRRLLASAVLTGLALALPAWAFAQTTTMPVIPPVTAAHPHDDKGKASAPIWQRDGNTLSLTASGHAGATAPTGAGTPLEGQAHSAGAGVKFTTQPGLSAHVGVNEVRWAPLAPVCARGTTGCMGIAPVEGVQRGEVGAGYAGHGLMLDLSIGQAQSESRAAPVRAHQAPLPRVLPTQGGADVAAPLWFRNSTTTSLNARGQVSIATDTSLNVGASVGRVRFLPGSGLAASDTLDQTTLSLGIQHGSVRGAIVGHMLEPDIPGVALDRTQRWSGVDLGISVRLPWRGELNFGAQNVWTSGHAPLLFGSGATAPDQGRVPYVQYHQDL